jgi:cytochrome P450
MEAYLEQMTAQIGPALAGWDERPNFRFYPAIKQLTLDLAAHVFAGAEMGLESDKVNRAFVDVVAASIAVVRNPVLGRKYARGLKGRAFLEEYYGRLVPERRGSNRPDMLTQLCNATGDDGESYSDREIVDHMIFLMMAAHDTTTSALTTMAYALAKHPDWQEQVRGEVRGLGVEEITHDDLERMELTERTFREALRLYTPLAIIPRRSLRPFAFGGYEFPANTSVTISPAFTHHMPELWTEPERFDPERFAPERAEDQNHKFAWTPFGGGAHKCIGMHFAYMQVKAFTHALLSRYRLELPAGYEMSMALVPIAKPRDGLPISIRPV